MEEPLFEFKQAIQKLHLQDLFKLCYQPGLSSVQLVFFPFFSGLDGRKTIWIFISFYKYFKAKGAHSFSKCCWESTYVIINQINVMAYKLIVLVLLEVLT